MRPLSESLAEKASGAAIPRQVANPSVDTWTLPEHAPELVCAVSVAGLIAAMFSNSRMCGSRTIQQMIDTQILPASYAYLGQLAQSAGQGAAAGINMQPIVDAANSVSKMVALLQKKRAELAKVITKAEHMHDDLTGQANYLTTTGCGTMGEVRDASDALELAIGDEFWPLPRYREMLFPV